MVPVGLDKTCNIALGRKSVRRASLDARLAPNALPSFGTLYRGGRAQRQVLFRALSETVVSNVVDTATAELIMRSAMDSHHAASAADVHAVSTLFHSLNTALGVHAAAHAADGLTAFADLASTDPQVLHASVDLHAAAQVHEAVAPAARAAATHLPTASLPMDPFHIDQGMVDAANQQLADMAVNSATMADAAVHAATAAAANMDHALLALDGLTAWAGDRLAVIQTIDPESYATMTDSLSQVVDGLKSTLDHDTGVLASQYTNALVLGVQLLVTGMDLAGDGSSMVNLGSMIAAQEAMAETVKKVTVEQGFLVQMSLAAVALIVASLPKDDWNKRNNNDKNPTDPKASEGPKDEVPLRYDPAELADYFSRRPVAVVQRNAVVAKYFCSFVGTVMLDARTGQWEKMMPERARWLRLIAEDLGPTYIKFVQAASTRVDMVPEAYLAEFAKLQDNVPTFSTQEAREVLEDGLGCSVDQVFDWISEEPLAAASLGQVYRGKLNEEWGGAEVAIKVQRPNVLESAALDIFVMRRACLLFSKLPTMSDQWACALDDWAFRFFQEMDYQLEAYNTMTFQRQMVGLEGVMVATVYPELTTRKVIVTEWVNAVRMANASQSDVRGLCRTLLNCYLIQLLETGLLHADPHPGNLMLTPDGVIVILDFGLVTEVEEDQRIALVEFIAHLMMENWVAVCEDLVKLGFMPDGMPPGVKAEDLAPIMQKVMGQLVKGGGIRGGINIMDITADLEGVARNYRLAIPPYFALVIRAFAVIEGIALTANPDYAIVHECMPYLSRRLLTDNNPRMRAALKQMLYGDSTRLDVGRLQRLIGAFSNFSTQSSNADSLTSGPTFSAATNGESTAERVKSGTSSSSSSIAYIDDGPVLNEAMKEAMKVVFAKDGSYAQELIVEELVAATDAMSREALSEALRMIMSSASVVSTLRSVEALGPLRNMLLPLPLPMEMISSMRPMMALTNNDRQALNTLRAVLDLLQPSATAIPGAMSSGSRAMRAAGEVMPMLPELLPGVRVTLELFVRQLVRRMALRLADDLEPGKLQDMPLPNSNYGQQNHQSHGTGI